MADLAVAAIRKNYPDGQIREIKTFHTADFTDEEDAPSGVLTVHPLTAKLHVDSIPLNAFAYLAIVSILPKKELSEAEIKSMSAQLHEAVPQFSALPPSLKTRALNSHLDGKNWNAELGEDENAFAGIFKQTKGRQTNYYIAIQAGAPMACKQLRERIARSPMTFEQLLEDKDYNYAHYIAKRNVERLAYNVARAMSLPIKHQMDIGAHREFEYSGLPMKAIATYMQPVSTIMPIVHNSERTVGVFNKLTPVANSAPVNFIYEGPYNGIAVYQMNQQGIGHALPSHSGKLANPTKLSQTESVKRAAGIICEGGDILKHPDIVADSFRSTDSEEFADAMVKLGWKVQNLNNLIPVLVKIFNPQVKRK